MMIAFVIMLALAFGIGGSLLIAASISDATGREQEAAISSHRMILYTLAAVSGGAQTAEYDELIGALTQLDSQSGQGWVSLRLSDNRNVIFQSNDSKQFVEALKEAVSEGQNAMQMMRDEGGAYLLQIAGQIEFFEDTLYLETIYDMSPVFAGRQYQQAIYQRLFLIVVALGALVSWILSYWMTTPLRKLSRVTRTIASGDLAARAAVTGRDEISILAGEFNNMAERLEENITELRDTMRRQEEFMGGVAHELKTPMTSIIGYADLLRSHALSDADRRDAANYIFTEGRRLEVLSLKLLDLIVLKRRDFTLVRGSVVRVVSAAARLLKPVLLKQNIRLSYSCDNGTCMMEPDLIMSLLLNLIDNARKALDNGGEIYIKSVTEGDTCTIYVSDNGRGISQEDLEKIKDAFYRVDKSRARAQGGVGLGLALCDEITELHGGTVTFESELGKGTRVTVKLKGGEPAE